jgi:hypothetical protein
MTETASKSTIVKLMPDWGIGPLWVSIDGGIYDPYDTDDITEVISVSSELRHDIATWDGRFQATLDDDDPASSGFPTREAETAFIEDGRVLAGRLRAELPGDVIVEYATIEGTAWRVDDGDQPM